MCETGAWRNFDELEDELTLDELFVLYEKTSERQKRILETIGAAFGAGGGSEGMKPVSAPITSEGATLFGYDQGEI